MTKEKNRIQKPKLKILLTGARGQLGQKLQKTLGKDFELVSTDREEMDVTNESKVHKIIKFIKPEYIIHCASYVGVDKAEEEKSLCAKINVAGSRNVAKAAESVGAVLIYISTDYVFDGKKKKPYDEKDAPNPLGVYGLSKFEGEKAVSKYCSKHFIIRTSWLFGEIAGPNKSGNFVEKMLLLAGENKPIKVVDDQIGSPTYTGDLAKVLKKIISKGADMPYGIYHFSGRGETSWYDLAKEIFKQSKIKADIKSVKTGHFPQKALRPSYSYLSKEKIKKALKARIRPWQQMLGEYLERL